MNANTKAGFHLPPEVELVDVETEDVQFDGASLDDERVDAIVARTRRAAENLTPGGKSLNRDGTHSKPISVRLPDDLHDELDAIAAAEGVSVSKLVRRVLDQYVTRRR